MVFSIARGALVGADDMARGPLKRGWLRLRGPRRIVGAVIPDGEQLLATLPKRKGRPYTGGWWLPSFAISRFEDPARGLERRLRDELGLSDARVLRRVWRHRDRAAIDLATDWYLVETSLGARATGLRPPSGCARVSWVDRELIREHGATQHQQRQLLERYDRVITTSHAPLLPEQSIGIDGLAIRYTDVGPRDAPVLLCVHGLGSDLQVFRWNAPAWSRELRVIALDLPGHGRSDKPEMTYSLSLMQHLLRRFMDALELDAVRLLGYSMGGFVASLFAAAHPERVERLILLAPGGLQSDEASPAKMARLGALFRHPLYPLIRGLAFRKRYGSFYHRYVPEVDVIFQETLARSGDLDFRPWLAAVGDMIASMGRMSVRDVGGAIASPTLILFGDRDRVIPPKHGPELARIIPGARLRVLPDCGHLLVVEARDEVTEAVSRFALGRPPREQVQAERASPELGPETRRSRP